jgi:hypothetical protein
MQEWQPFGRHVRPASDESNQQHPLFFKTQLDIILNLRISLGLSSDLFPSDFSDYNFVRVSHLSRLTPPPLDLWPYW